MLRKMVTLLIVGMSAVQANAAEIPDVVVQYATSFTQVQLKDGTTSLNQTMLDQYARNFFMGFTHPSPDRGVYTKSAAVRDAYTHGQTYWREHPDARAKIFAGYGYTKVDVEGAWSQGFEKSSFEPSNSAGGKWWMKPLGDGPWSGVGLGQSAQNGGYHVHILGYLSPEGHYGHLGAYEHEILVTAGTLVESGNH